MTNNYYLNDLGIVCALGGNRSDVAAALFRGTSEGMVASQHDTFWKSCIVGQVRDELPAIPAALKQYQSRNNQLILAALADIRATVDNAIRTFGAQRVGVVIGTSTSGIAEGEQALRFYQQTGNMPDGYHYLQQALGSPSQFLRAYLGLGGPSYTVSTACSSSARALVSARRMLALQLCDAVVVGGADSLCGMTVQGFSALETVSAGLCNPLSVNRDGINIGEGAALFVMSREASDIRLMGVGCSSDAYHISAPDPSGAGAIRAMQAALDDADLTPDDVDYLNLHGTATRQNDAMESCAVAQVFNRALPCSSTKAMTGHTLGAAGAIEVGFCWLTLRRADGRLPPHLWDGVADPELPALNVVERGEVAKRAPVTCMSNSFAFGGNNAVVVLGRCGHG